jgi:hypothetical protein
MTFVMQLGAARTASAQPVFFDTDVGQPNNDRWRIVGHERLAGEATVTVRLEYHVQYRT